MGITGLLPFTKPASTEKHLKDFKGQTAAIDSYCWLHKGAFGCAEKLAKREKTDGYINYCFKYIDMLLSFKIKPIMVLDGNHLPAKLLTEQKRRESRKQARKRATECLKLGKMAEARNYFQRCVDITPEMAFEFIKECRKRNIDCVVAPYEADAQLAYLNRSKMADFVISEDSDLLAFGCTKVLFKLDLTGRGTLVESDKLYLATKDRPDTFSLDKFRHMCILSGCDYLDSLPGIGLKKAWKFLKSVSGDDIYNSLVKLPKILNMPSLVITKEYREQFMIADATFRHQLVFDVTNKKLVPLTDPETSGTNLEYCCNAGKMFEHSVAFQIAIGNFNPFTYEKLSDWEPQKSNFSSIWCGFITSSNKNIVGNMFKADIKPNLTLRKVQTNIEIDNNVENKILMLYSVKTIEEKIVDETIEPPAKKIKKDQNLTSPILSGRKGFVNPFLKNRQTRSQSKIEKEVVSKYFIDKTNDSTVETDECSSKIDIITSNNSNSDDEEVLQSSLKENETQSTNNSENETEINELDLESEVRYPEEPVGKAKKEVMSPKSLGNVRNKTKSPQKMSIIMRNDVSPQKSLVNVKREIGDSSKSPGKVGKDMELVEKYQTSTKNEVISPQKSILNTSNEAISSNSLVNVRNSPVKLKTSPKILVKCRPQGLNRNIKSNNKFKTNKNQPTLLHMFGFTKK